MLDNLDMVDTVTSLPMPHDSGDTRMWSELDGNHLMDSVATVKRQKII